jgi:hypothetical protein
MKKIFTALLIFTGFYTASFAQKINKVEFGANVGYNGSYIQQTGTISNSDGVSGFNLGVSAEYYFSDRWSIKGKVIYDQKGWGNGFLDFPDGTTLEGVNFQLNYITVPVMANWHFGRTRNWYLHFGPYAGFLTSAKENSTGTDVKAAFNSTDFGLDLGIGIKIPVSDNTKIFFEYDGQGGVSNVFNSGGGPTFQNTRESINIGVLFSMK